MEDWVRRDAGGEEVGVMSYYACLLKAYIFFGVGHFLKRFIVLTKGNQEVVLSLSSPL